MCDTLISQVYFTQSILHAEIQINENERCVKKQSASSGASLICNIERSHFRLTVDN